MKFRSERGATVVEWTIIVALITASAFWLIPTLEVAFMDRSAEVGSQSGKNQAEMAQAMGGNGGGGAPPVAPPVYVPPFTVLPSGGIEITGATIPKISILGSAITYGAGGPQVPVSLDVSVNGANVPIFKDIGSNVTPTSGADLSSLSAGARLDFKGRSYHPTKGTTLYTQQTATASKMIIPLRNGDLVPAKTPFGQQPQIKSFLTSVINPTTGAVTIQENQVLYLMELGTNTTSSPAADFQDLVFLATF